MRATGTSFKNPISEDNQSFMNVTGGLRNKNSKSKAFGDRNQTLAGPSIGIREKLAISGNKNPTTRGDMVHTTNTHMTSWLTNRGMLL